MREFQALGGVDGHQRDRLGPLAHGIQIRDQRHVFQKAQQPALGRLALVFRHGARQLHHVLFACLRVRVLGGADGGDVAGFVEHFLQKFARGERNARLRQIQHQRAELAHRAQRARGQHALIRADHGGEQAHALPLRELRQRFDGRVANAAARLVDDAAHGLVVVRVGHGAHVGQHVLDFLAVVELHAAVHAVRHAAAHHGFFQHAGLRVRAVKHGEIARARTAFHAALDGAHHPGGLVALVERAVHADLLALARVGPQRLFLAARVVRDHLIGRVQDVAGGAIVLLQLDHPAIGKIALEFQNVAQIRAAPAVNGLVVVAHHAQIARFPGDQPHEHILRHVRILVFVHQDVRKLVLVGRQHRRMLGKQRERFQNQIVEIQRVVGC